MLHNRKTSKPLLPIHKSSALNSSEDTNDLQIVHANTADGHPKHQLRRLSPTRSSSKTRPRRCSCVSSAALLLLFFFLITILSIYYNSDVSSSSAWSTRQRRSILDQKIDDASFDCDVAILGAGPAGLTAALFSARANLRVFVIGSSSTGQLAESMYLDNFPSFFFSSVHENQNDYNNHTTTTGEEWLERTQKQVMAVGAQFIDPGIVATRLSRKRHSNQVEEGFELELSGPSPVPVTFGTRAVIVATGATSRKLGLPYESFIWGRSVHTCAICDGSAYAHRTVVVVGGGDAALDAVALLTRLDIARIILVHRRNEFKSPRFGNDFSSILKPQNNDNNSTIIQIKTPYTIQKYELDLEHSQNLAAVHIQHVDNSTAETERIPCDGVFLMIGSSPNTEIVKDIGVKLDDEGFILIDPKQQQQQSKQIRTTTMSSIPGVFAAGEVTDGLYKQAITGAAAGAKAAMDAERWLRNNNNPKSATAPLHIQPNVQLLPLILPNQSHFNTRNARTIDVTSVKKQGIVNQEITKALPSDSVYDCDLTTSDCITSLVHRYPVVVFSKVWCPYCKKALEALSSEGVRNEPYLFVVQLGDKDPSLARRVQATLASMTGGRRTVPNVFVGGTSIGGGDETVALHRSGKLRSLLVQAKAIIEESASDRNQIQCDLTEQDCITSTIHRYPVVMFSKTYCPFCRMAIETFRVEGVSAEPYLHVIDLVKLGSRGAQVQETLFRMTGRRTVPNIFIGGKYIGGGDETVELHRGGKLKHLLEAASAVKQM